MPRGHGFEAGGAGTYTQRAIPGCEPSQEGCTVRPRLPELVQAYHSRDLLPGRPSVVEDAGGPLGRVAGDAAQAAGLLARGVCSHDGLALLLPALTQELGHLAGQCVVFLPGAFLFSLPPGFVALLGGLAAFDGLPAPGHRGPGPGQRLLGAFLPVW